MIKLIYMLKIHTKQNINFLIKKLESTGLKYLNDSKTFIEYSNDIDDTYKNIEEYNPNKKRKILIVFGNMIADMFSNKKLNPIETELFKTKHFSSYYHAILFRCSQHTILLSKFQIKENFNKFHLIIHQILTLKTL